MILTSPDNRIRLLQDDTNGHITATCAKYGHRLATACISRPQMNEWHVNLAPCVDVHVDRHELRAFGFYLGELVDRAEALAALIAVTGHYLDREPVLGEHTVTDLAHAFTVAADRYDGVTHHTNIWSADTADQAAIAEQIAIVRNALGYLAADCMEATR